MATVEREQSADRVEELDSTVWHGTAMKKSRRIHIQRHGPF